VKLKSTMVVTALILIGALSYGGMTVFADSDATTYPPFVSTLADKLGLSEDEVNDVFDEIRADHFAQMQENRSDSLTEAVKNGVITEDQKNQILDKWSEMQTERIQERQNNQEEIQNFFNEIGVDSNSLSQYLGNGLGSPGPHHMIGGMQWH
jgi:restriction endonuclease